MNLDTIALTQLRLDGGTQPRPHLNDTIIAEFADMMREGLWDWQRTDDPITVFYDGDAYWLAHGFHRTNAAQRADLDTITVALRQGTLRDAQWFSYSVNRYKAQGRTNDEKRRAVKAGNQWNSQREQHRTPMGTQRRQRGARKQPCGSVNAGSSQTCHAGGVEGGKWVEEVGGIRDKNTQPTVSLTPDTTLVLKNKPSQSRSVTQRGRLYQPQARQRYALEHYHCSKKAHQTNNVWFGGKAIQPPTRAYEDYRGPFEEPTHLYVSVSYLK